MAEFKPNYTDDDVFVLIEMQFGKPPRPIAQRYSNDPGLRPHVENDLDYYNDITQFLTAIYPADLPRAIELRRAFYRRHGIFSFDSA